MNLKMMIAHHARQRVQRQESGAIESAQIFAWIAVTVAAIVLLGGMLEVLGVDLINWVRAQIGI